MTCRCANPILPNPGDHGPRCCRRCWSPLPGYRVSSVTRPMSEGQSELLECRDLDARTIVARLIRAVNQSGPIVICSIDPATPPGDREAKP